LKRKKEKKPEKRTSCGERQNVEKPVHLSQSATRKADYLLHRMNAPLR